MENRGKNAALRDRLREALANNNMKPIDLSKKTGIPKSMVSYYLSGKSEPKSDRVFAISQALGISEAWLLGYDVPMTRTPEAKKNDAIVSVVKKLQRDQDFFEVVSMLAELPPEQFASLKNIISALGNK